MGMIMMMMGSYWIAHSQLCRGCCGCAGEVETSKNPVLGEEEEEIGVVRTRMFYLASSLFCEPLFNVAMLKERVKRYLHVICEINLKLENPEM
ncbi:unnamed protein product [Prunus armeniaca]